MVCGLRVKINTCDCLGLVWKCVLRRVGKVASHFQSQNAVNWHLFNIGFQIMPATREDVIAAVRGAFSAGDEQAVLAMLDLYGAEPHERERERVQLAIVHLSRGSADRLQELVQAAKTDYRDILSYAQGPLSPAEGEKLQRAARDLMARWGKR